MLIPNSVNVMSCTTESDATYNTRCYAVNRREERREREHPGAWRIVISSTVKMHQGRHFVNQEIVTMKL